jgi:hypothetical protein
VACRLIGYDAHKGDRVEEINAVSANLHCAVRAERSKICLTAKHERNIEYPGGDQVAPPYELTACGFA